jgi:enoyl-CoA hydratase
LNLERDRCWTASELGAFLSAPDAAEQFSPVDGPGVVILDLAASSVVEAENWRASLLDQLPVLPCVTIAIEGEEADGSKQELRHVCDVTVRDARELDVLLAGFAKTPISALAFVQLLRTPSPMMSSTKSRPPSSAVTYAGLVAESFVYSTLQSGAEFNAWLAARPKPSSKKSPENEPACRLQRDGGRLGITLTRPARHNAFSRAMRDALVEGLQLALLDASIEEVVLRGEGASFCSGGDLDEFGSLSNPAMAHAIRTTRSPALLISRLANRTRVELHGACLGAGIELPAFCDRICATEDAFFALPEVGLGLVPGAGGTVSLPRRIGRQRTAWLGLSGSRIDSRTALAWGLVDEVRLGQHPRSD